MAALSEAGEKLKLGWLTFMPTAYATYYVDMPPLVNTAGYQGADGVAGTICLPLPSCIFSLAGLDTILLVWYRKSLEICLGPDRLCRWIQKDPFEAVTHFT